MAELELNYINDQAKRSVCSMIVRAETAYAAAMRYVADSVIARGNRLLLLAGPSSSGKTTSANLIADRIRSMGHEARVVSLDNFYRPADDPDYPLQPNGQHDYECVEALQIGKIHKTIEHILACRDTMIPRFDFKQGKSIPDALLLKANPNGVVILEGLHALNPILTSGLPSESLYRLFVSVSTNVNDGGQRILSGRKIRFCRRLVRDSIFRATDGDRTLSLWKNVLHGEDLYLYPYKDTADFRLNTFHDYELGVLRDRALALLDKTTRDQDYVAIIKNALSGITEVPSELVPATSLIREFISGGIYEDLY